MTRPLRTSTRCTVARDGAPATPRCATSNAIRRAPHRGCARRSSHTSASASAASRDGEVRGRRETSRSPSIPAAACRAFHAYTDCRDTPYRTATSPTGDPSSTSSTARSRCSTSQTRSSCFCSAPMNRRSSRSRTATVKHLPTTNCQACRGPSHDTPEHACHVPAIPRTVISAGIADTRNPVSGRPASRLATCSQPRIRRKCALNGGAGSITQREASAAGRRKPSAGYVRLPR